MIYPPLGATRSIQLPAMCKITQSRDTCPIYARFVYISPAHAPWGSPSGKSGIGHLDWTSGLRDSGFHFRVDPESPNPEVQSRRSIPRFPGGKSGMDLLDWTSGPWIPESIPQLIRNPRIHESSPPPRVPDFPGAKCPGCVSDPPRQLISDSAPRQVKLLKILDKPQSLRSLTRRVACHPCVNTGLLHHCVCLPMRHCGKHVVTPGEKTIWRRTFDLLT